MFLAVLCLDSEPRRGVPLKSATSRDRIQCYVEARNHLGVVNVCETELAEIGIDLPKSRLHLLVGIVWQSVRFALDRLYVFCWLTKLSVWLKNSSLSHKRSVFYYQQLQRWAHLSVLEANPQQHATYSHSHYVYYSLATLNACEACNADWDSNQAIQMCCFYSSVCLYIVRYTPAWLGRTIVNYFLRSQLINMIQSILDSDGPKESHEKLKHLLNSEAMFEFLTSDQHSECRAEEETTMRMLITNEPSYIIAKFRDFLLSRLATQTATFQETDYFSVSRSQIDNEDKAKTSIHTKFDQTLSLYVDSVEYLTSPSKAAEVKSVLGSLFRIVQSWSFSKPNRTVIAETPMFTNIQQRWASFY